MPQVPRTIQTPYKLKYVDVFVRTRTPFDALLCGTCFYGLFISMIPFWPQQQG
jgi:hypothetical protein